MTTVYVIKSKSNTYKIGFSANPKKRLMAIRSSNCDVRMISIYNGTIKDERALHEMFKSKRIRGEWFILDNEDLSIIDRYFVGKESIEAFRRVLLEMINIGKSGSRVSFCGGANVVFHELPPAELDESEILAANDKGVSLKTVRYFKRIWLSMPDASNREIQAKTRYSDTTTKHVMAVIRSVNKTK